MGDRLGYPEKLLIWTAHPVWSVPQTQGCLAITWPQRAMAPGIRSHQKSRGVGTLSSSVLWRRLQCQVTL